MNEVDQGRFTIGVFQDAVWARRGVDAILADGFARESVSVIARRSPETISIIESLGAAADPLAAPGPEPLVAAGPLLLPLQGNDRGLERLGIGATIGRAGFLPHDGFIYEALVARGGVLVGVRSEPRAADVLAKLHAYGGGNAAIGAWTGRV
jgi:hypothetical protein